ncbi:MAG: DUF4254 domain-containing protein [Cytophagales bacterium]
MITSIQLYQAFELSINDYHLKDSVHTPLKNPFESQSIEYLLYHKNWIDTVQWHLEDIIRRTDISTDDFISTKRWIDRSNQERTDLVEKIDDKFILFFESLKVVKQENARMNSESIAWLVDRMSILMLKIYHMHEQTLRTDVDSTHLEKCNQKLGVLQEQKADLGLCFDQLIEDIQKGIRFVKVYRQMKMYNDQSLNPELYKKAK